MPKAEKTKPKILGYVPCPYFDHHQREVIRCSNGALSFYCKECGREFPKDHILDLLDKHKKFSHV
jgi:hypothetical protein